MRALFERFTYRYQLWREEQEAGRWGADPTFRNPLRYVALFAAIALVLGVTEPFVFHRILHLIDFIFIPTALLFLVLYYQRSRFAWYLCVAWLPLGSAVYWLLRGLGYSSYPAGPRELLLVVAVLDVVITVVALVWLFRIRRRYFHYIEDAGSINET